MTLIEKDSIPAEYTYADYVERIRPKFTSSQTIYGDKPNEEKDPPPKPRLPQLFGGEDFAKRVDHSAFISLELEDGVLYQHAHMEWPHTKYGKIADDTLKINEIMPHELIGFDRTGVGDAVIEMFDTTMLPMSPVVATNNRKLEIIRLLRLLFNKQRLKVDAVTDLPAQIEEQEERITNAGNTQYAHPVGKHDDLFWALGYAVYVAVPSVGVAPAIIKQGTDDDLFTFAGERDVDSEIEMLMGGDSSVMGFGNQPF